MTLKLVITFILVIIFFWQGWITQETLNGDEDIISHLTIIVTIIHLSILLQIEHFTLL